MLLILEPHERQKRHITFEDTNDAAMRRAGVNTQGNAKKRTVSEPLPQTSGPPITLGEDEGDRAERKTVKVKRTREEGTTPVTPTDEAEKYKAMVAAMTAEVDEKNEGTGKKAKATGPNGCGWM